MLEQELQKIYDSEINVSISWLWDGGIDVKLGDAMNGFADETNVNAISEVLPWVQHAIHKHYPRSTYNLNRLRAMGKESDVIEFPLPTASSE